MDLLRRRCQASDRRSRERRAGPGRARSLAAPVALALAAAVGAFGVALPREVAPDSRPALKARSPVSPSRTPGPSPSSALAALAFEAQTKRPGAPAIRRPALVPGKAGLQNASAYARGREGAVSFAVIDSRGELRGRTENRRYPAASVVKAMLLAAELRRLAEAGQGIDPTTDSLLEAMITYSDNAAADAIYSRVGDAALQEIAARAGMTRFTVASHWGTARIAAADMARFFGDLDELLPRRHRDYGQGLLGSVIASQAWGIPAAAGERWAVRFKGGWLPDRALVHQAAELRERGRPRELALAVLSDHQPSHGYGTQTVRGVAARLLGPSD